MVPTGGGNQGKPGKMGKHFPVTEKSGNFVKTGKVRERSGNFTQNTGKIRKNYTAKLKRILEKSGKFCQTLTVKTQQIWYNTSNKKEL